MTRAVVSMTTAPDDSTTDDRPDATEWLFVGLALALAGVHLYLALFAPFVADERATLFVLIAVAFLAGVAIRFTRYWDATLYLLAAGFATFLGAVRLLDGPPYRPIGVATGVVASAFLVLAVLLFVREGVGTA